MFARSRVLKGGLLVSEGKQCEYAALLSDDKRAEEYAARLDAQPLDSHSAAQREQIASRARVMLAAHSY